MNNSPFGISVDDLRAIVLIFRKHDKITQALLFGSRAKGTFHNGSDIDIALKGTDLELDDLLELSLELEKLPLANKFDLIIFDRIKEPALLDHITRVGIDLLNLPS